MTTFGELVDWLHGHYPPGTAEPWDRVGVVCGEPDRAVSRVLLTVDVTPDIVAEARGIGAQAIIAHHPLLLRGVHGIDPRTPKGRMVTDLVSWRIGLVCAHTNADIGPYGTVAALAAVLGLQDTRPLRPRPAPALDKLVTFVPAEQTDAVVDALAAAGAGAIGDYDRCHFTTAGTGSFRPLPGATPYLGEVDRVERVAEDRVELVLPREQRSGVLRALLAAHPYEEPAWDLFELAGTDATDVGMGRIGTVPPTTLGAFAEHVASQLPATAVGVRVAGDPDRAVRTVAIQAGAGDDLLDVARERGADAYLTSDLRHHPASEARCWQDAPALLDVAHWAAEWTWLPVLRDLLGRDDSGTGALDVVVSEINTDPWTAVRR